MWYITYQNAFWIFTSLAPMKYRNFNVNFTLIPSFPVFLGYYVTCIMLACFIDWTIYWSNYHLCKLSFKEAERKKEKIYINWICYINFLIYSACFCLLVCFFLWIQVAMWCYFLFQYRFVPVFLLCIVIVKYITCLRVIEPASQLKAYCFMW